jgi:aldehyde:ferredoxin oxidoreductase
MMEHPIAGGLAGKILRVDLTSGLIRTEPTARWANRWIGGRAVNSAILFQETGPGTRWSDPRNPLIFGSGALVGTAPGANRMSIDCISVFNNGKGSANLGGHFAAELKFGGFDHIVVTGKAERPVYLQIEDGCAELREAQHLWGMSTYETEDALKEELKDSKVRVACIGPSGENRVPGSIILADRAKAAGGSGVGCVMGDKRLKAVAVRGRGSISIAKPEAFLSAVDVAMDKVKRSPTSEKMWRKTLAGAFAEDPESITWDLLMVVRNGQDESWEHGKRKQIMDSKDGVPGYREKILACFGCPIGCMPFSRIREGRHAGTRGEGFWVNTLMLSTWLDIPEPEPILKAWLTMNQLGIDGDYATGMMAWAFECYQKGLLTKDQTDGLDLTWGNAEALLALLPKIARREGIGELLALGPVEAPKRIGRGSEAFAIHMKGQPSIEPYRAAKGWGLGVATSPVAGRHLRGSVLLGSRFGPKDVDFDPHVYEGQAQNVFWQGLAKEIEDITGICVYVGTWSGAYALEISDYAALINAVMGLSLSEPELMRIARKSRNLEKAFNTLNTDMGRLDDMPPRRYMEEPIESGPYKGHRAEPARWHRMLDEFYTLQGWDAATGLQTRSGLSALDMQDVAEKLAGTGRLIER